MSCHGLHVNGDTDLRSDVYRTLQVWERIVLSVFRNHLFPGSVSRAKVFMSGNIESDVKPRNNTVSSVLKRLITCHSTVNWVYGNPAKCVCKGVVLYWGGAERDYSAMVPSEI